jgi:hypothetical protein
VTGLEPISPELVLVDPELRATVLADPEARPQSAPLDELVPLPVPAVSPTSEADAVPDERRPRSTPRAWPRWTTQLAVLVAFGLAGYAVSSWTVRDATRSSAEPAPQTTFASIATAPLAATTKSAVHVPVTKAAATSPRRPKPSHAVTPPAQTFIWAPVGRAAYYDVRFFRNGQLVFEAWPSQPRLQLPARWVHEGHARRLVPGPYSWRVFPVFGSRAKPHLGAAIVRSTWTAER